MTVVERVLELVLRADGPQSLSSLTAALGADPRRVASACAHLEQRGEILRTSEGVMAPIDWPELPAVCVRAPGRNLVPCVGMVLAPEGCRGLEVA